VQDVICSLLNLHLLFSVSLFASNYVLADTFRGLSNVFTVRVSITGC
jgi:hypothetical protein